jgi:hypothetical protein
MSNTTSPRPVMTADAGSLVNLTLTSADGIMHNLFVDYNGQANPSEGEPKTLDFQTVTLNCQLEANVTSSFTTSANATKA